MNRKVLALVVGTGLAAPALLRADEVDQLGGKVTELDAKVYALQQQLKPPAEPGSEIADRRLIDAQVLYELKNYEAASIILFDVVEKYPSSPAFPEALFYLADSLYQKRDFLSSGKFFQKVVELGPQNPRYQEALQRLIELSLHTGDYGSVEDYITKLESVSVDKQLPSVPYVKGKYYYFRRQFDKALDALAPIKPGHIYYFHAQYFIAAANVAQGPERWDPALNAFAAILKEKAVTDSQKRIAQLAHMGTARILLERGQLTQALDEYSKIEATSDQFNDTLYESAWVAIKGKDFTKARQKFDLLLLNSPDSPLAPEVKLLLGSLQVRQDQFGPATDSYTKTRDEYEPVYRQLSDELTRTGDPPAYFRDLIAKNLDKFDMAQVLPQGANRWVKEEPDVQRVSTLIGDENDLKRSLDDADGMITRLEKALSGPQRVNVYPELAHARAKATEISNQLVDVKKQLGGREAKLLAAADGAEKAQLDGLDRERAALEAKLAALPMKDSSIVEREARARAGFNELDKRASKAQTTITGLQNEMAALRKMYVNELLKKEPSAHVPPAPDASPSSVPAEPAEGTSYDALYDHVNQALTSIEKRIASAQARADKHKDVALKSPLEGKSELDALGAEVAALQVGIEDVRKDILDHAASVGVGDSDMQAAEQVKAQYEDLLKRQHALAVEVRARMSQGDRNKAEQIESILDRVRAVDTKIVTFNAKIDEILDVRLKDLQASLADEKKNVAGYRETLGGYRSESTVVGGGVVADSFDTVKKRFYNIVVRADVGIIDVAWALKDQSSRESTRLVAERKRELKLLDDEFKDVLKDNP